MSHELIYLVFSLEINILKINLIFLLLSRQVHQTNETEHESIYESKKKKKKKN